MRRSAATVGNALEVIESIETLKGNGPADLEDLSVLLAARMLVLGGRRRATSSLRKRRVRAGHRVGRGVENVPSRSSRNQGGDPTVIDDYSRLPAAPDRRRSSRAAGRLRRRPRGRTGRPRRRRARRRAREARRRRRSGGRASRSLAPVGSRVATGDPCLVVHHRGGRGLDEAVPLLTSAIAHRGCGAVLRDRWSSTR